MSEVADRPIRFIHRGAIVEVADAPTTKSVLYWLREDARRIGTKEGCNEGDCGACMVIVASLDAKAPGGVALQPVNACLQFLSALDGRALLTVEDLKHIDAGGSLHPAQQAMVDCHGSQCGFCTPGFTMSLAAFYDDHVASASRPGRQAIADALSGNLCRCTGYRPILDAGERMFDLPTAAIDRRELAAQLESLGDDPPLHYRAREFASADDEAAWVATPHTVDALAKLVEAHPDARLVAGTTDVGLWVTKQHRSLPKMIRVDGVDSMKAVDVTNDGVRIGAGASLEHAWDALVAFAPGLREMQLRFASAPLRAIGTMGGNVANGSPIGDSPPVLLALDATLVLRRGGDRRRVPLSDFYVAYMKNRLEAGEFIEAIEVPRPHPDTVVRGYKISKRHDCDISTVAAGMAIRVEDDVVVHARFAFGGMDGICRRSSKVEALVTGSIWDDATVARAIAALRDDFAPLSDLRGTASFRLKVAGNLLRRLWLETRDADPVLPKNLSVWPRRELA
jgi:xanthine dehydrogenase small subunit